MTSEFKPGVVVPLRPFFGSTLYVPVFAPGALFEIGDGHAAQGDGEVDQTHPDGHWIAEESSGV